MTLLPPLVAKGPLKLPASLCHAWQPKPLPFPRAAVPDGCSQVIDESTGAPQPWLYSRGPWNQKQYGAIHT
jgi:hypothetical protein